MMFWWNWEPGPAGFVTLHKTLSPLGSLFFFEIYTFSHIHGSVKWLHLKGNYYWRDPFFTFMIMGGRAPHLKQWKLRFWDAPDPGGGCLNEFCCTLLWRVAPKHVVGRGCPERKRSCNIYVFMGEMVIVWGKKWETCSFQGTWVKWKGKLASSLLRVH